MKTKCYYWNFPTGPMETIQRAVIRHKKTSKIGIECMGGDGLENGKVYLTNKKIWYQLKSSDGIFPDFETVIYKNYSDCPQYCLIDSD